jgi:hypothetical protein
LKEKAARCNLQPVGLGLAKCHCREEVDINGILSYPYQPPAHKFFISSLEPQKNP